MSRKEGKVRIPVQKGEKREFHDKDRKSWTAFLLSVSLLRIKANRGDDTKTDVACIQEL